MGKTLGFHVESYENLSAEATTKLLQYVEQAFHDEAHAYCLFIAVFAKGDKNIFKTADETATCIALNGVKILFESIRDKPKIFFFHLANLDTELHHHDDRGASERQALYTVPDDLEEYDDDNDTFEILFMYSPEKNPTFVEKFTREMTKTVQRSMSEILELVRLGYSGRGETRTKYTIRQLILPVQDTRYRVYDSTCIYMTTNKMGLHIV